MSAISSMNVRTNIATQQAHRYTRETSSAQTNAARRLSSGKRITSAADDPAGMAITETMTAQIRGLDQASDNAQDGIALLQTAEGALAGVSEKLHRIRELLVQASNDTYVHGGPDGGDDGSRSDRVIIQQEIDLLLDGINQMVENAEYNRLVLLGGDFDTETGVPLWLQLGANSDQGTSFHINGMSTARLGALTPPYSDLTDQINIMRTTGDNVSVLIEAIDNALSYVNDQRSRLGAIQNRVEYTMRALDNTSINLSDARSRIRDADMAREMMDFMHMQVLFNVGTAMMAQGNQLPNNVLQLLQM